MRRVRRRAGRLREGEGVSGVARRIGGGRHALRHGEVHGGRGARVKLHGQRAVLRHAADGEDVAVLLYNGGIRRGEGVAAHTVALGREGRDGVAADGDRAAGLVGRDGRERERSGIAAVLAA